MKFTLKDYQRDAVRESLANLADARDDWHRKARRSAFSLTAVTGAGKTVMAAAAFEALFHGDDEYGFEADPGAVVIWFSDDPSLNEQTRFRLLEASDRIGHSNLVVVENTFNRPRFQAGKIYFLNTQKLGKNSLLVRGQETKETAPGTDHLFPETRPDNRAYTIWDTIQNTIEDPSLTLYLVLDEAHRGMGSTPNDKGTIVKQLINGFGGVPGIPVVWGISATVDRFNRAIESASKHIKLQNVVVDLAKVQESGLIKDTILLDIPDEAGDFDTVLVRRATDKLKESTAAWREYSIMQDEASAVVPLMVLQVPNKPDPNDIGRALDTIFSQYPKLPTASVAHVFGEHTTQRFGNRDVPYIEPQQVQESNWVRILIAKDAISTGWDCPRAEVMVSFRAASDRTHITQLLGRMVRSPLARRIPGNDRLNSVNCLLSKFDRTTVTEVVRALMSGDELAPPTGRILLDYVEVKPNPYVPNSIWTVFESLPSQTRPQKGAKPAKRLTAFAHELASDGILPNAGKLAHAEIHNALDAFMESHKEIIEAKRESVMTVDGRTVVTNLKGQELSYNQFWEAADMDVIDDAYNRSARIISPDIARTYVDHLAQKVASLDDPEEYLEAIVETRVTVGGLGLLPELQAIVDQESNKLTKVWQNAYSPQIKALNDDRKEAYRQIIEMSTEPQSVDLAKPESRYEATKVRDGDKVTDFDLWDKHLLCDERGSFPADLNRWEKAVVETESDRDGFQFWYRNPDQAGQSSLGIAYQEDEEYKILRPDFVFFAIQDGKVVVDIVDPHGHHLADSLPKLLGLAKYAEIHSGVYRRIIAMALIGETPRFLDLTRADISAAIKTASSTKALFEGPLAGYY
jgi:type III restriction enzyme